MVDQEKVSAGGQGAVDGGMGGVHAHGKLTHLGPAFDLQALGTVVGDGGEVEKVVEIVRKGCAVHRSLATAELCV